MLNLAQLLYGGGGRLVSAQSNQNGAGIVELEDENNPYTFGDMYANQGINVAGLQTPATTPAATTTASAGPSAAYIADKSAKYPGQGVPGNPRPSEYHWWIPGYGWSFMPEYDAGNNLNQQYQAMNPVQLDNAYANGYTHQMSSGAQAVADSQGISVTTGPAFLYEAQYPENQNGGSTTATPAAPAYTMADVTALYQELLNRPGKPENKQYWLNALLDGSQTLEQVRSNIMLSEEYQTNLANAAADDNGGDDSTVDSTVDGGGGDDKVLLGYYWFNAGSGWQWYPYYTGEAAPAGSITAGPESVPTGQPDGWENPDNAGGGDTTTGSGGDTTPVVETPQLYTPTGDQFFQGMFTANDLLFRDGGDVSSEFYNNLRQNILTSLAQTATDNGRTQNTAEEIALAQGGNNSYSAYSLFDPTIAGLVRQMGI